MRALAVFCGLLATSSALVRSSTSSPGRAAVRSSTSSPARASAPDDGDVHEIETTKMSSSKIPSLTELDDMLGFGGGDGGGAKKKKRNPNIPSLEMIEAMIDDSINDDDAFGGIPRAKGDW